MNKKLKEEIKRKAAEMDKELRNDPRFEEWIKVLHGVK